METPPRLDDCPPSPPLQEAAAAPGSSEADTRVAQLKKIRDNEGTMCVICWGNVSEKNRCSPENCLHIFCFDCLVKWSRQKNLCPLCKKGESMCMKLEIEIVHCSVKSKMANQNREKNINFKSIQQKKNVCDNNQNFNIFFSSYYSIQNHHLQRQISNWIWHIQSGAGTTRAIALAHRSERHSSRSSSYVASTQLGVSKCQLHNESSAAKAKIHFPDEIQRNARTEWAHTGVVWQPNWPRQHSQQ